MKGYTLEVAKAFFYISQITQVASFPAKYASIRREASEMDASYDYIVIGGGTSGLTVANRLSEDPSKNVLVIEYGYLDKNDPDVLLPADVTKSLTPYLFNIMSTPQPNMNNRSTNVVTGAVVGGSTAVNGMTFGRGSAEDYDNWAKLGNPGWDWAGILPYFKKSTTFTPPGEELKDFNITYDQAAYGDGPVQSSYPRFLWPGQKVQWKAWLEMGVTSPREANYGNAYGTLWIPSSEDPKTETRSFARTAHYDPAKSRPNFHLLVGHQVREVLFSDDLKAIGISFHKRNDTNGDVMKIMAKTEIILAAGAVHSPQILQRSGVGPKELLKSAGIKQVVDLPGVGANLQDHPNLFMLWTYLTDVTPNPTMMQGNSSFYQAAMTQYYANRTGPRTMAASSSMVLLPLKTFSDKWMDIIAAAKSEDGTAHLPLSYDKTLKEGYKAQREILIERFSSEKTACMELPFGGGGGAPAVIEKPLSRGTINLDPADPYGEVIIDAGGLADPIDIKMMIEVIRYTRKWIQTPAHQVLTPLEIGSTANLTTDAELEALIRNSINPSFAHTSGTLSMMPRELGGVVGSDLLVYGVSQLSVVDASIQPMIPSTHISSTVYAVAEKAADLIKNRGKATSAGQ